MVKHKGPPGFHPAMFAVAALSQLGASLAVGAPNACDFLSSADVTAAVGGAVTGGKISQVDPTSGTASCMYTSAGLHIGVTVSQYPSADAARKQVANQLQDSRSGDGAGQKTSVEAGVGDAAFSSTMTEGMEMTVGVVAHGPVTVMIAITGKGAAAIAHDRFHALLAKAVSK
ncbi:MAG: hypothetical protein ABSD02_24665 [Steroidobacteraceae bacterium]|jgi:hypothetical protein